MKRLERLINMTEGALFIAKPGPEIELVYANSKFYSMLQYTRDEYKEKYGNSLMASILPEEKQRLRNLIARQNALGGTLHLEYRVLRKDGTTAWISLSAHAVNEEKEMYYYCSCLDITKAKRSLEEVYQAKRELDLIANSIPGGVIKLQVSSGKYIYANDGYFLLTGYSRGEFQMEFGNRVGEVVHPMDAERVDALMSSAIHSQGLLGFECRILTKSGETKWIYVNGRRIDDEEGEIIYLCVIMDITAKKQMESEFEECAKRAELLSDYMGEVFWTYDMENKKLSSSGSLGISCSKEAIMKIFYDIEKAKEIVHPDDWEEFQERVKERVSKIGNTKSIYRMKDDNGSYRMIEIYSIAVDENMDGIPDKIYGATRILDRNMMHKEVEAEVLESHHALEKKVAVMAKAAQAKAEDSITGLQPYASFLNQAEKLLQNRGDAHYAIVCADINEFRQFSHHYGFSMSNEILKIFSTILQEHFAKDGMCTRVDGDYFIVLLRYEKHKELLKIMSEVVHAQEKLTAGNENIRFGTTTGVYLIQPEDTELAEMLEKADLARRSIKGLVGNHYAIYTEDLQQERFREEEIIQEIVESMTSQKIEICYTPRICNTKDNVVGCKAVPRVQLRDGQYIESERLIRLLERSGHLTEFVFSTLDTICCTMNAWLKKGYRRMPVAIEMTAGVLSGRNAVKKIDDIVRCQNQIEPQNVIIEVSERYFSDVATNFVMAIEALVQMGYQVVISRFGSDHTAIHSLRHIPVTGIKFHGEYFHNHETMGRDRIVLQKLVELAEAMNLSVSCGGINTHLQEEFAKEIGCRLLEGEMYYGTVKNNVFEKCFLEQNGGIK